MRHTGDLVRTILSTSLALILIAVPLDAQGKGQSKGGDDKGKGRRGTDRAAAVRGTDPAVAVRGADQRGGAKAGRATRADQRIERRVEQEFAGDVTRRTGMGPRKRFKRDITDVELRPALRQLLVADGARQRVAVGAIARAHLRGVGDDALLIAPRDDRVRILNRAGIVLVDLDSGHARDLGGWDVVPLQDDVKQGSPAFCRSGHGHPVFGRQWCLDQGFGLAGYEDIRWARTRRLDDVVFLRPVTTETLARDGLLAMLGAVVLERLGLHAITLGLTEPLVGRWVGTTDTAASRVLLLTSGGTPVAEIVDTTRDDRADVMLVALRDW